MAIDKQFHQDMAQRHQKRSHLLEQLGIENIPVAAPCTRPEDPTPIASLDRYFIDKQGNRYRLSSDEYRKFCQLLDQLAKERLSDNAEKLVKEFLEPFREE